MQLYVNSGLIQRNNVLGRVLAFAGLGLSIAAAVIVIMNQNLLLLTLILMLVGGFMAQLGTAYFNRYGREPRVDQILATSLKGLDDRHALFHYLLGVDHVLFTPAGVFALIPRWEEGEVRYADGDWFNRKPRGRLALANRERALRGLERQTEREVKTLDRSLRRRLDTDEDFNVRAIIVFVSEGTQVDAEGAPYQTVHRKKLKGFVRSLERGHAFEEEDVRRLAARVSRS